MNRDLAPPLRWNATDQQLWQRAVEHVDRAIADGSLPSPDPHPVTPETRWLEPLRTLLRDQRASDEPALDRLADTFASACMGRHHLWQDLGLAAREEVSRLMELGFPILFQNNTHNLRWKRHLFLCLGQVTGRVDMKPPKCDHCELFVSCMGSPAPTLAPIHFPRA